MSKGKGLNKQTEQVTYGAGQGEKVFTLRARKKAKTEKGSTSKKNKLAELAESAVIRNPRSYKNERIDQTLRHIATTVEHLLIEKKIKNYQEVQVGFNSTTNKIYISTNNNSANEKLEQQLANTDLNSIASKLKPTPKLSKTECSSIRQERHRSKFKSRWSKSTLSKATVLVTPKVNSNLDGLHAERRIKSAFGIGETDSLPDDIIIKGIKRPCAHCYPKMLRKKKAKANVNKNKGKGLKSNNTLGPGPGPAWQSKVAQLGNATPSQEVTRITRTRNDKLTVAHDTDSDSDVD